MPTAGVFAVPFRELSQTNEGPFTMVLRVLELAPHMGIPHPPAVPNPTSPPPPHDPSGKVSGSILLSLKFTICLPLIILYSSHAGKIYY